MDDGRETEVMNAVLKCRSLSAGYHNKPVVSDVNFEIHRGEIVAIIGANGAGKSTLLKTVAGLLPKLDGSIELKEKELTDITPKERARKISVLLTDKIHSEYMTSYDVIATGRYAYTGGLGMLSGEDREAIKEAIHSMDIEEIQDKLFDQLSDGQKQRVMLARAICQKPEIILLDEPTSFLDIGYKIEMMSQIQKMAKNGIAVLMTMHDLDIAKKISDKVISIKDGRVDRIGTSRDLFEEEYLCRLFGVDREAYRSFFA